MASFVLAGASCGARTDLGGHLAEEDATAEDHKDAKVDHADVFDAPPDIVFPDVPIVTNCEDAGTQYIYVITESNELYSFFPPSLTFAKIGDINCSGSATPFSMAVDRSGIAYSVFTDGNLFQVSTLNAACKSTTFKPNQGGITTFGMGFSGDVDAGETLYIAADETNNVTSRLASIDTQTFALDVIGQFQPQGGARCELTGTGDGRLFAFCDRALPRCAPKPRKIAAASAREYRRTGKPRTRKNPRPWRSSLRSDARRGARVGSAKVSIVGGAGSPASTCVAAARSSSATSAFESSTIQSSRFASSDPIHITSRGRTSRRRRRRSFRRATRPLSSGARSDRTS
ncbi:MAG TPA: hypothetical protein VGH87_17580 [Polyangiaceae bacterium]